MKIVIDKVKLQKRVLEYKMLNRPFEELPDKDKKAQRELFGVAQGDDFDGASVGMIVAKILELCTII